MMQFQALSRFLRPLAAVIQALLCTALGLPPSFFRRFSQSNAAFTVLEFQQDGNEVEEEEEEVEDQEAGVARVPWVLVERMNQVRRWVGDSTGVQAGRQATTISVGGRLTSPAPLLAPLCRLLGLQFPDTPLKPTKLGKSQPMRLVLITGSAASPAVQASPALRASLCPRPASVPSPLASSPPVCR